MSRRALLLCAALLAGACTEPIELPAAQPLRADAEQLAGIHGLERGPLAVDHLGPVTIEFGERPLRVRAVVPVDASTMPLLLFSHGFASDIDEYDAVLDHWASHGYASVAVFHRDGGGSARAIAASLRLGKAGLIASRVDDLHALLDHLDALDALAPGLATRLDRDRIGAAGHSFGAFTAQQLGGAAAVDPDDGRRIDGDDPRVRVVVALSPPGEMFGLINARSYRTLRTPMLATTGTWDVDGRFVTEWRQHALSFEQAPPGDKRLLVVDGADHYLGNLICRTDRETAPQTDALRMVNAATLSFLDAHFGDAADARSLVDGDRLAQLTGGFARMEQR